MGTRKKKTLVEEINDLMTTKPTNFDSDEEDYTKAKVVQRDESDFSEDEHLTSNLRKKTAPLLADVDKRYAAKKVSRKVAFGHRMEEESSESDENEDDEKDDSNEESISGSENEESDAGSKSASSIDENSTGEKSDSSLNSASDEENSEDEESESDKDNSSSQRALEGPSNIQIISQSNLNAQLEKANSVRNQCKLWEKLLELRIKMEKTIATANKMPQHDVFSTFMSDSKFKTAQAETVSNVSGCLKKLLEMQNILLKNNSETRNILSKSKKKDEEEITSEEDPMDEEIPSDSEDYDSGEENNSFKQRDLKGSKDGEDKDDEDEEKSEDEDKSENDSDDESKMSAKRRKKEPVDYGKIIPDRYKAFSKYRDSVIQKWDDKTRISSGNANKDGSQAQSVLKQIEFILGDKEKLRKRTRRKRSNYDVVGKKTVCEMNEDGRYEEEFDNEIFDDSDFYHQLLREVIESKSSGITDPLELSKQWAQLQNMRSKMKKRNIDTRATKGRKIRYAVHQKLINFMAPITCQDSWSDSAKNELFSSLFSAVS